MSCREGASAELLSEGMDRLGLGDTVLERGKEETVRAMEVYRREVELWNPRYKLTAASGRDLTLKHFLDSLAPWRELFGNTSAGLDVLDVGSGGGFPGIPLAIAFPRFSFGLIEKSGRRIRFLENVRRLLQLENVRTIQADYRETEERADLVIFRAVTPLSGETGAALLRLVRRGGRMASYKGRSARAQAELNAAWPPGAAGVRTGVVPVEVPFLEEERCLAVVEKLEGPAAQLP